MAEVLGILGGCFNICQALSQVVQRSIELYDAPADILALQGQLKMFHGVVQTIELACGSVTHSVLNQALVRARDILWELHELITMRIIRGGNASNTARRLAWIRHKQTIAKLCRQFKDTRKALSEASTTVTLITIVKQASSTRSTELHEPGSLRVSDRAISCCSNTGPKEPATNSSQRSTTMPLVHPASPFERSPGFYPEAYTSDDSQPTMFCYYNRVVTILENVRVNDCSLFYRKSQREWYRLTARITTTAESKYWDLENVASDMIVANHTVSLPLRVMSRLTSIVQESKKVKQDMQISVLLNRADEPSPCLAMPTNSIKFTNPTFIASNYLQQLSHQTRHWKVPRYSERELDRRVSATHRSCERFFAYLDGRWVLERRFGSDRAQIETNFHFMKALHHAGGAPGVVEFLGLLVDAESGFLIGFLTELPARGRLYCVLQSTGPPMDRRLKWCRQLVQAVANCHSRDLVIGYLGGSPGCGLAIDSSDNLLVYQFRSHMLCNAPGTLPPEHTRSQGRRCMASTETDLYQMGIVLWSIAAGRPLSTAPAFCRMLGCTADCQQSHSDSYLPFFAGEQPPAFLLDVIGACRVPDPVARLPAHESLARFPQIADPIEGDCLKSEIPALRLSLEDCRAVMGVASTCHCCGKPVRTHSFQCGICNSANYNICLKCMCDGHHCLYDTHYLKEIYVGMKEQRYYTNVKAIGKRDVIID